MGFFCNRQIWWDLWWHLFVYCKKSFTRRQCKI